MLYISILAWGLFVIIIPQCRDYSSALAVKFLMDIFEAAVTPGLTLMTEFWYTRREIPLRQCIWYSSLGWGGIVGSYKSKGFSGLPENTTPERWELLYPTYLEVQRFCGLLSCIFCFPDAPSNARFLSHRERIAAVKRFSANGTGIKNKSFNRKQALVVAFHDPKAILLFVSAFAAAMPNGVVNSFSTIIIRDLNFSTGRTTELRSVGDAVQIVALFIGDAITLNVPNSRLLTSTAANILCTVSAVCMACLPPESVWDILVSFWLVNAQSVRFTVSLTAMSSNMAGYTHRSLASAIIL
ncbi:major facilitator superfamily domain-containing protein [Biscogniauxia sp. FL1348]|nr:major facilitator superfamily domain-containing protein [Biscogniauxia sp. FL1348]